MDILPPLEEEDKMFSALSYPFWFITSLLVGLTYKKNEPFVMYHVYQGLFLGLFFTITFVFLLLISSGILFFLKGIVVFFIVAAALLSFFLSAVITWFFFSIKALKGETPEIILIKDIVKNKLKRRFVL